MKLEEDKFDKYLKYLNHFTDTYFQWEPTKARKEHIDEYGIKISIGDTYYKREYTKYHNDILKLSKGSIDKLLFLIAEGNDQFQAYGQHLEKKKEEEIYKALNQVGR